jgi:acetyl-CoA carboxylase carboxyltransferase component
MTGLNGTAEPRDQLTKACEKALRGGDPGRLGTKLPVRRRLERLLDAGSWVEDGLLAHADADGYPADGVLTGYGKVDGRPAAVIAHDPTVKAGSWGALTVEKQIRLLESADRDLLPVFYLVDSAGGRLTDQLGFFPGRRGAARIFHLQVRLSGRVPQLCCLLGPSAAGGAYMPAFCDWVGMVDGTASMYLASPRIAATVTGEQVTMEEMGGARMHTTVSGLGDQLFTDDAAAIDGARRVFSYLPSSWRHRPARSPGAPPARTDWDRVVPDNPRVRYDIREVITRLVDTGSFCEIKSGWAGEIVVGFARLDGHPIAVLANQPMVGAGALFIDSADKAARFIMLADAFNVPLLFLQDLPGFMVGSAVERQGIIRHGAKMIAAMATAAVPRFTVIVRKAYAAGYYAMSAPGFEPHAVLALPTASVGAMGAEAAINAVYANKIAAIDDPTQRQVYLDQRRAEYEQDLGLLKTAAKLHVDAVVAPGRLRAELIARLELAAGWERPTPGRHHPVWPV